MRARLGQWTPFHTLAVLWAAYLGPLVYLWAQRSGVADAYGPFLLALLLATGWLVPWWVGAVCLALASVLLPIMDSHLLPFQVQFGSAGLNAGLTTYALGLLFLAVGRALRWGWGHLHLARAAGHAANEERERKEQLALVFRAAAHEIANPLTPLAVHVKLLQTNPAIRGNEAALSGLERIDRSVDRLTRLVTDFQDVARGLQGEFVVQPRDVDLAPTLRDLAHDNQQLCQRAGLTWSAAIPSSLPWVADPDRIGQAVMNLCQNAIRYTPSGGAVGLAARIDGGDLVIEVRDTGIGLAADETQMIFEPFRRLHAAPATHTSAPQGSGLGLWIVRRIARAHGGEVTVHSGGPGQGATFQLRLGAGGRLPPLAASSATASSAPLTQRA